MIDEKDQLNKSALSWLYEMEMLDSPVLRQNLYENIFMAHRGIKDCKVFITPSFTHQRGILIWLKLKFWTRIFDKKIVYDLVASVVSTLLPSYRVRIVEDEYILQLAEKKLSNYYGGTNEHDKTNKIDDPAPVSNVGSKLDLEGDGLSKTSDLLSDSEEQTSDQQEIRDETQQRDSQDDNKTRSSS